jgi:predicted metalloprotease
VTFDDQHVDVSGVEDRRGAGGAFGLPRGVAIGGGGGIVGLIITVLVLVLGGGGNDGSGFALDPGAVSGGTAGESQAELAQRCNTSGAIERYDDCYLIKVYDETDEVWSRELARRGVAYHRPTLTFFGGSTQTGCGPATSQVGPFYCPVDQRIYLDLDFLDQLQQQYGAQGRYAQAYILAHEYGHHLQTLLGIEQRVRQQQDGATRAQQNALSVRLELQADCLAGVWGKLADTQGNVTVTQAQVAEAQSAAAAVGDDRIEAKAGVQVDPETWTHGSAGQRRSWYTRGFDTGDLDACDTFAA